MSDWRVPLTDIAMPEQDVQAVLDCLESGWLTMGPRTEAFEEALAEYVGTPARGRPSPAAPPRCTWPAWRPGSAPATR